MHVYMCIDIYINSTLTYCNQLNRPPIKILHNAHTQKYKNNTPTPQKTTQEGSYEHQQRKEIEETVTTIKATNIRKEGQQAQNKTKANSERKEKPLKDRNKGNKNNRQLDGKKNRRKRTTSTNTRTKNTHNKEDQK